jgi:hypothetical protein
VRGFLALKFEYWYQNHAEFYAKLKTVEKTRKKLLTKIIDQKSVEQ